MGDNSHVKRARRSGVPLIEPLLIICCRMSDAGSDKTLPRFGIFDNSRVNSEVGGQGRMMSAKDGERWR